jgi:hypothetical protein
MSMTNTAKKTQWQAAEVVAHILQNPPPGCPITDMAEQELYSFFEGWLKTLPASRPLSQRDRAQVRAVLYNWYMQQQFMKYLRTEAMS